jgi:antitoxin MazE
MPQVTIGKWGKNLAIRFPSEIVKAVGLTDGERVELEANDGNIVIRRPVPHFTLAELFEGKSPDEWRAAYRGAFEWGPDVGREVVEE